MKTCKIIYNPTSGKKDFENHLDYVVKRIESEGYKVTVEATFRPKHAITLAKNACKEMVDLLVISGGDGTFHECLNGISKSEFSPVIGYIPSGTACDLASTLKIPKDVVSAVDIILNGEVVKMDYTNSNKGSFIYVTAIGTYVDISYVTDSKTKKYLGYLAYLITGIKEFFTIPMIKTKIEHDNGFLRGYYSLILVVNSKKVAGFNIVNKPILDDGKVDVVVYKYIPLLNNIIYFISFLLSPKILPGVRKFRTSNLKIYTNHPHKWNMDGEEADSGNLVIQVQKQALNIIINPKIKDKYFKEQ
ncbi:Diacylglycerol kinase [Candidatus Izimaplasma bacterium HR1]|uniref:diacylglycerol/lipid kinase family protein n=1 Tax=Candidatus Izimoplasma sp. HR1 TaxID=1541959 RepID=UPI0004F645B8|nr:Diacylglycerol kinase [Candidatus Izimaplasma bacterium HR1]